MAKESDEEEVGEEGGEGEEKADAVGKDEAVASGDVDADLDEMRTEGRELVLLVEATELDRILAEQRQQRTSLASAEEAWLAASGELEAGADPA